MFSQIAAMRRSVRCVGRIFVPVFVSVFSFSPWDPVFAQDAQQSAPGQPTELPAISVTAPPPSRPTNQGASDSVVVSPTTIPTPSDQSASSTTVITAADIESQQLRTVPDVLSLVPGLNVVQTGGPGGQTSVFMRGTNSNHVKVLIDGIDVSDPSNPNQSFDFGQLLTGDIARIEVLRGPQSGLYGSDAIGGVISITTKQGSGPPRVTASVEGGSFGTFNQRASLSGSQENFNYVFNIQHFRSTDTPVTPLNELAPGERRNNDNYDNVTYSTKLGANVTDNLALNLVARYTDSTLGFTGEDSVNFAPPAPEVLQSTQVDHQFFGRGEAVWSLFDGRFKNFFGFNYTNEWSFNLDPNPDSFYPPPTVSPPTTNLGTRTQYDWRGEARIIPGQTLVMGLEDKTESLWTNSTGAYNGFGVYTPYATTAQTGDKAGWLELQSAFAQRFFIVSNIRYDDNESFGPHTTWRVAPVFIVPWTDTKLKATYGTGFKAPTLTELYVNFPSYGGVANPNLLPETSTGYDLGFEQPLLHDRVSFGATYFHNDITNLIVGTYDPVTFISSYANIDKATTQGVESFASGIVSKQLRLRADYTYTEARDDITGLALLRRPANKVSASAIWLPIDKLSITATLLYVSSWSDINRSTYLTMIQPGYTTARIAAEYAVNDNWTLFARIENLFNEQYEDPAGFLRPGFGVFGGLRISDVVRKAAGGT
ncbi:MAG TPA: TonB-dependent receptor [Xanthobacteraceae bacterium]|nr:TonB-dependent receptor [Xanthobacteraceae bacterium]